MARSRIEIVGEALEHQSDADLAVRAGNGDREAFEELYRRHSRTAMRVAYRVTGNIHDASDAVSDAFARVMQALPQGRLTEPTRFRSYLLTSTRHAAVDVLRRAGRAVPSDTSEDGSEPAQTSAGPGELLIDRTDNALVAAAFRALPERWRSVLWLTEVEGIPAREAAGMLGVSPNGVAQLAVRARAGLRERYLQAHLTDVEGECRDTVRRLGAHVGGALAPREIARVDQHLAWCDDCRVRRNELEEIGTTLRRAAVPVPLLAGGGLLAKLAGVLDRAGRAVGSVAHSGAADSALRVAPVGAAAAAVFVASIAGVGVVRERQDGAKPAPVAGAPLKTPKPAAVANAAAPSVADAAPSAAVAQPAEQATGPVSAPRGTVTVTQEPPVAADPGTNATAPEETDTVDPSPAPPPSRTDEDPPLVEVPDVDAPEVPVVEVPEVPVVDVPEVPVVELPAVELPALPAPLEGVSGVVAIDSVTLLALAGATDTAFSLWLDGFEALDEAVAVEPGEPGEPVELDEPLPSPEAPGLPV